MVVDPRRTETADLADEHLFIRPGDDPPLLLALLHMPLRRGARATDAAVAAFVDGVDVVQPLVAAFPPEVAPAPVGGGRHHPHARARLRGGDPAVAYGRVGV